MLLDLYMSHLFRDLMFGLLVVLLMMGLDMVMMPLLVFLDTLSTASVVERTRFQRLSSWGGIRDVGAVGFGLHFCAHDSSHLDMYSRVVRHLRGIKSSLKMAVWA
jgi:hypothetical protein